MVAFNTQTETEETEKDPSWALSMLAGIPSGIIKIAEGAATLGATLLDLGVDKDRAESVEQYFADINPFDDLAGSTAIGKITELITNLAIPGGMAFKLGNQLTKTKTGTAHSQNSVTFKTLTAPNFNVVPLGDSNNIPFLWLGDLIQEFTTFWASFSKSPPYFTKLISGFP